MATGNVAISTPKFFGYKTRNASAGSGNLFGVYYPDTRTVIIHFYFTSNSNVEAYTLFTIDEEYSPSSTKEFSCMIKQAASSGNILFGNGAIDSNGNIRNNATMTAYQVFGIITYSLD